MSYDTKIIDRERIGADIMLVRLKKPEGFEFLAGQYCSVTVPDMGFQDERGLRRTFSIASSPLEKDLLFVMKMSNSALKRTIAEMPFGTDVTLEQPLGSLILPKETKVPLVFLAGGVGITPFRSMMRYAVDANTGHAITLLYSSQTPEETPFLQELQQMAEDHGQITAIITMTRVGEDRTRWSGATGRVSAEMIKNGCKAWESAGYYVVGPPAMATGMKETLLGMNIPQERIKMELFAGY
jgi:ferredoxin-NADP reductase